MIYFTILMIYYSSDSPSSLITLSLSVTQSLIHTRRVNRITVKALVTSNIIQSVCLVGKGRLKERCGLEPRTNYFFLLRNLQKLVRIRFGCGLDSRIYGTNTCTFTYLSLRLRIPFSGLESNLDHHSQKARLIIT